MADPFEYDVFISFSSADEEIVKPIWQELCSNGLRVFWSDSALKKEVGNSWFEVIEKSLERSRHMLLICSDSSMNSKWVQREYRAFFDYCYSANSRRLIPLLTREFQPNNLPLFLRQLQVGKINDPGFIQEIIPILGGVNIEKLQHELQSLREQVNLISKENESLREKLEAEVSKVRTLDQQNTEAKEQIAKLTTKRDVPNKKPKERENSLSRENITLKKQMAKLTKENNLLHEKLQEQEKIDSSETTPQMQSEKVNTLNVDKEEREKAEKLGIEIAVCPNCGTLNSLALMQCEKCHTSLNKVKPIRNPYL